MQTASKTFLSNVVANRRGTGSYGHVPQMRPVEQARWEHLRVHVSVQKMVVHLATADKSVREYDRLRKNGWKLVEHIYKPGVGVARVMQHTEWRNFAMILPSGESVVFTGLKKLPKNGVFPDGWVRKSLRDNLLKALQEHARSNKC